MVWQETWPGNTPREMGFESPAGGKGVESGESRPRSKVDLAKIAWAGSRWSRGGGDWVQYRWAAGEDRIAAPDGDMPQGREPGRDWHWRCWRVGTGLETPMRLVEVSLRSADVARLFAVERPERTAVEYRLEEFESRR